MPATLREIRQVARPLLDGDPRLAFVGRAIVLPPVGHWLRGFSFAVYRPNDRNPDPRRDRLAATPSNWKGLFWPRSLFQPLYVPASQLNSGFGRPLSPPGRRSDWRVSTPGVAEDFRDVATDAIATILNVDTADKFCIWAEHAGSHGRGVSMEFVACLSHALAGRLGLAIRIAERNIDDWGNWGEPATPAQARRLRRLIRVFQAGQARTNRLLRTFEWITARHLGVARWWTWTPAVG
jgi:hypothetical protein